MTTRSPGPTIASTTAASAAVAPWVITMSSAVHVRPGWAGNLDASAARSCRRPFWSA
ncbi:hypothetical protein OHA68_28920 [Nonomuraea glycinis]|nr:hypothetical protein OHA68_28920 [Nonomuraea glycinis]